ncbi:hypothetical protein LJC48_02270 [Desulfovibrio sp. OttesenSCG-928-C06]|nr:hypothetical protein [Desulfovibrio sp. OttesenSCG-928-C06]
MNRAFARTACRAALVVLAVLLFGGCAKNTPIYNIQDSPVPYTISLESMESCILDAGKLQGWKMTQIKPGLIEGVNRIAGGRHVAEVSIPYTATHYSILYKSSVNLKESNGRIHRTYNSLVRKLETSILNNIKAEANLSKQ